MAYDDLLHRIENIDFRRILQESKTGYVITDEKGFILFHNPAYVQMLQLPDSVVGINIQKWVDDGATKFSVALMALREKRRMIRASIIWKSIPYLATSELICDPGGKIIGTVTNLRNQTDFESLQDEIRKGRLMLQSMEDTVTRTDSNGPSFIAVSQAMRDVFRTADTIRHMDPTIFLCGESGVGKEIVARYIHSVGLRRNAPFVAVNCGAIPENLLESELFGYAGGSFTGANRAGKRGLLEAATGGILFLDEIGDLPLAMQVKLLRVLENATYMRVGEQIERPVELQFISASHQDLSKKVREGTFREDLYYRLNVVPIKIPALRERREDIIPLCQYYLSRYNEKYRQKKQFSTQALDCLRTFDWPGNVRQLKNAVERLVATCMQDKIRREDLHFDSSEMFCMGDDARSETHIHVRSITTFDEAVAETERQLLVLAREKYGSCRRMAAALGIDYSTVARKLKAYGLSS